MDGRHKLCKEEGSGVSNAHKVGEIDRKSSDAAGRINGERWRMKGRMMVA